MCGEAVALLAGSTGAWLTGAALLGTGAAVLLLLTPPLGSTRARVKGSPLQGQGAAACLHL
jgi:hypothetical protein